MNRTFNFFQFSLWSTAFLLLGLLVSIGCERRTHYRRQADREVDVLVANVTGNPQFAIPEIDVYMDDRSRYFDPFDPDRSPMPQDDPESHQYMHCVDGKKGYRKWHQNGVRDNLENEDWLYRLGEYVTVTPDRRVLLDMESAVRLAKVNSPDYQSQLETIYLSALDVSTERFRLDTQFFAGSGTSYSRIGQVRGGAEQNTLDAVHDAQINRQFAGAGTLLVGFANNFVWKFTGNNTSNAFSLLNFSLVQPLLRSGGRVVGLERLTVVERTLLANLRAFERYRHGFYTQVAIGSLGVSGPQRRGGFLGGTGLTGFTGTGAGGIGGVGAGTFGGGGTGNFGGGGTAVGVGLAGGGAGTVGGFIGLLQRLQEVRNARDSLELQLRTLSLLEGNLEGGLIDLTQVDQFRQSIETQKAQLLQVENTLQTSIDTFISGTLGLPPDLQVELDDHFIEPFQLIDPKMTEFKNAIYVIQDEIGETADEAQPTNIEEFNRFVEHSQRVRKDLNDYFEKIRNDVSRMADTIETRRQDLAPADAKRLEADLKQLEETLQSLEMRLGQTQDELDKIANGVNNDNLDERLIELIIWLRELLGLQQEIELAQARGRLESVSLEKVQLDSHKALAIAKANRLDLKNQRADLVNTWRLIAFNANALNADLDLTVKGDVQTVGNNLAKFDTDDSSLSMGVRIDSPFTRLVERNNYRQSLIDYQRARRSLIQFEDSINGNLRALLRQLDQLETNLEIQRRAVAISIRRVDFTQAELNRPLPVPVPGQPQPTFGPTAVQNLLSALADLRNSQNNFMSVWLNHYATRMTLMRELGLMDLDEEGNWLDRKIDFNDPVLYEYIEELPPNVPQPFCESMPDAVAVPTLAPAHQVPEKPQSDGENSLNKKGTVQLQSGIEKSVLQTRTVQWNDSASMQHDQALEILRAHEAVVAGNNKVQQQQPSAPLLQPRSANPLAEGKPMTLHRIR
jgi:outer membrane protein TolC